jgi:hypothetical protein
MPSADPMRSQSVPHPSHTFRSKRKSFTFIPFKLYPLASLGVFQRSKGLTQAAVKRDLDLQGFCGQLLSSSALIHRCSRWCSTVKISESYLIDFHRQSKDRQVVATPFQGFFAGADVPSMESFKVIALDKLAVNIKFSSSFQTG